MLDRLRRGGPHAHFAIPWTTYVQDGILDLPFPVVITGWLATYVAAGLLFFLVYMTRLDWLHGQTGWTDVLGFSFITQATVGYGDVTPKGWWLAVANLQAVVGTGLNGAAIGLVTFRIMRRPGPILASDHVSFQETEDGSHWFHFRYISLETKHLSNVTVNLYITTDAEGRNRRYDTFGGNVKEMSLFTVPPMITFALWVEATVSDFKLRDPDGDASHNDQAVAINPAEFFVDGRLDSHVRLLLRISGYHSATGDAFLYVREYRARDIRCRSFETVQNRDAHAMTIAGRRHFAASRFDSLVGAERTVCSACAGLPFCPFGPAAGQAPRGEVVTR